MPQPHAQNQNFRSPRCDCECLTMLAIVKLCHSLYAVFALHHRVAKPGIMSRGKRRGMGIYTVFTQVINKCGRLKKAVIGQYEDKQQGLGLPIVGK